MISPVIAKIISMQQSFTVSENEIAQYVMNNAKIGYKGFNSFKVALAQGSFFNSMQAVEAAGQDSLVASISRDYSSMLLNTTAMLDENQVLKAAKALAQAGHIYIFSNSLTALAAKDLEFRLGMVGIYAKAVTDIGDIRIYASCATREDFVIAIAPSLLIRDFYNAITVCKDNGAGLLSITSYDSPKLAGIIDYKFIISDKITTRYSVSISNTLMYLYVVDVLYCALLENDRSLKQRRMNSDTILSNQQQMDNYFFEY